MDKELLNMRYNWRIIIENDGGHCPVCDRWGKIYGRTLNETMAKSLIWLVGAQKDADAWVDVPMTAPRWLVKSNQLPTLKWWGLVERLPNSGDSKNKHSGMWRSTTSGCDFVKRKVRVSKKVFTYNDSVEGFSDEKVTIDECFKEYFDYQEIMNTAFGDSWTKDI
jgi:hypothetical protein